jgi:hypothetical protein
LSVMLESYSAFDAEVYADEVGVDDQTEYKEDQRSMIPSRV